MLEDYQNIIEDFTNKFNEEIEDFKRYLSDEGDVGKLCRFLFKPENLSYRCVPYDLRNYGEDFSSAIYLLHSISNAIDDDGDISFIVINGEPMICFFHRTEDHIEKHISCSFRLPEEDIHENDFYFINDVDTFIKLRDEYVYKELEDFFVYYYKRGVYDRDTFVKMYSKYKLINIDKLIETHFGV